MKRKAKILIRPAADRDLDQQAAYLASQAEVETALRFYRAAQETFELLAIHPEMGRKAQYRNPLLAGLRVFPLKQFGAHLVFYKSGEQGIEVIRVLHGARHIEAILEECGGPFAGGSGLI